MTRSASIVLILALSVAAPHAVRAQIPKSGSLEARVDQAAKLVEQGNSAGAIRSLEELRKDPSFPARGATLLAALYLQAQRPKDAMVLLQPLADAPDAPPAVLYNAGRAALALHDTATGERYLRRSLASQPDSPAARELGLLVGRQGKAVEAYQLLRPWVLQNPLDREPAMTASLFAIRLERPAEALQMLQNLADDPAVRLLRGQAQVGLGDGKAALQTLAPLAASHPPGVDLEVRRALAEAHLLAGQPAETIQLLSGKTAGHPPLALLLAKAQQATGDTPGALATLAPFASQLPDGAERLGDPRPAAAIAVEYGTLLVASKRAPEAVPVLERATRIYPTDAASWTGLSQALAAAGRAKDAAAAKVRADALRQAQPAAPSPAARPAAAPAAPAARAAAPVPAAAPDAPMSPELQEALRLMKAGEGDEALAMAKKAAAADPKDPRPLTVQVRLFMAQKLLAQAL